MKSFIFCSPDFNNREIECNGIIFNCNRMMGYVDISVCKNGKQICSPSMEFKYEYENDDNYLIEDCKDWILENGLSGIHYIVKVILDESYD